MIAHSWPRSRWLVPVLLVIYTLFFFWKCLFTNRYMLPWDASDFFYPYLAFIHEELRHFRMPLWDPFAMAGFPIIGDPEAQIFYPLNWLMVLLHPSAPLPFKFVEAMEIFHFFLAGLFMYWLAKEFTKNDLAALLGGVLFMSSGAMVAHTEHFASIEAMAWYPLVFMLARRGLLERNFYWTAAAGFFMGIENLVGHLQHAVYLGLLLLLYFGYEACAGPMRRRLWPHWFVHLSVIAAIGTGLAFVQLVPTSQLGPQSIRTHLTYWDVTGGNNFSFLWTLFLPNMFGGLSQVPYTGGPDPSFNFVFLTVPGCLLALVGLLAMLRRRNFFWLGLILLTIELSRGRLGFLGDLVFHTPVLNLFRQMPVYFDLGNFALCLMAAVGAHELLNPERRVYYRRWAPTVLFFVLLAALAGGQVYQLGNKVHGWYHMIVALALSTVLLSVWIQGIRPQFAAVSVTVLMTFELCYYSRDKWFNLEATDPRTNLAFHYAGHRTESLAYLRSDQAADFRVAGFDGSPWGSNGCNVWRLQGIFGWNPVMLRNYQDLIRQVIHTKDGAQPYFTDHCIESPVIDLLGVKYLVVNEPTERSLRLPEYDKFEKVFAEENWRTIYRNKDFLSRAWFYPNAYVLPDGGTVLALLNSHWFDDRRTLLIAAPDLPAGTLPGLEPLRAITLQADQVTASSAGNAENSADCSSTRPIYRYWDGKGNWIRFRVDEVSEPGRYVLLAEYVCAGSAKPTMTTEVSQGGRQSSAISVLPRTWGWNCRTTRSAELGTFELAAGPVEVTIRHLTNIPVDLFALRLVRLPEHVSGESASGSSPGTRAVVRDTPDQTGIFSFSDFEVTSNSYSFSADVKRDGFVLLNEIYYPGWEASVDGIPVGILPADYAFRALPLRAGSHRIALRFRPPLLWFGGFISLFTLVLLAGLLVWKRRTRTQPAVGGVK